LGDDPEQSRQRALDARERESGIARLEEAVAAYRAALTIFVPAQADHYIEICAANKDRVDMLLKERSLSD